MPLTESITTGLSRLVWSAVKSHVESYVKDYLTKRRIERAVEEAVDRVVLELESFLVYEVREENQQMLVVEHCLLELQQLVLKPEMFFRGSLDGQRIFDQLYPKEQYPQAIKDEHLEGVWALFVPRILALLCKLALAIEEWRIEGWREGFRRLDEVAQQLARLQLEIDTMVRRPAVRSDELFERVRRLRRQRRELSVEVTGLGGEAPSTVQLDAMFVHPVFEIQNDEVIPQLMTEAGITTSLLLKERGRSVIIAGPGAGKTTWTKWIERVVEARPEPTLVVRIELRQHSSGFPSIHKIVKDEAGSHLAEELDADILRAWFDAGRVHALIDGLDELVPEARESALSWLTGLGESVGNGAVVVTSRPLTTDHLKRLKLPTWTTWRLMPFDESRICDYIERWYKHAPLLPEAERRVNAQALAREWSKDSTLKSLTGNPLLLSTLLTVHHVDGALPQGRARLYQRYLDGMLGSWDARRKVDAPRVRLDATVQRLVLRNIAIFMNGSGRDAVEEAELEPVVAKALNTVGIKASAVDVLAQLRERSGLLIGPGTWSFSHKSIGEFLLAEAIIEGNMLTMGGERLDRMWLYAKRHEDRLNIVFFLWAGLVPASDLEAMIDVLLHGVYEDQVLGFGLANDQFFRLGEGCRLRVGSAMAQLIPLSEKHKDRAEAGVWAYPFRDLAELPTGQVNLRGVSGYETSVSLLGKLVVAGAIDWSKAKEHEGPARTWLWLLGPAPACWYETENGQPPSPPPFGTLKMWWRQAAWFYLEADNSDAAIESRIKMVESRFQDDPAHLVLLLMAAAVSASKKAQPTLPYIRSLSKLADTSFTAVLSIDFNALLLYTGKEWLNVSLYVGFAQTLEQLNSNDEQLTASDEAALRTCQMLNERLDAESKQAKAKKLAEESSKSMHGTKRRKH